MKVSRSELKRKKEGWMVIVVKDDAHQPPSHTHMNTGNDGLIVQQSKIMTCLRQYKRK